MDSLILMAVLAVVFIILGVWNVIDLIKRHSRKRHLPLCRHPGDAVAVLITDTNGSRYWCSWCGSLGWGDKPVYNPETRKFDQKEPCWNIPRLWDDPQYVRQRWGIEDPYDKQTRKRLDRDKGLWTPVAVARALNRIKPRPIDECGMCPHVDKFTDTAIRKAVDAIHEEFPDSQHDYWDECCDREMEYCRDCDYYNEPAKKTG